MKKNVFDIVAAISLAIMALAAFALQLVSANHQTSIRETALFNTIQFILTIGFTWFGTRIVSAGEFEKSLKKFAIGAYRRISDIDIILNRLKSMLRANIIENPKCSACSDLQIATAVIDDAMQMTASSVSDWGDVIGDEIKKLQSIANLEEEKRRLTNAHLEMALDNRFTQEREKINSEISKIKNSLPATIQISRQNYLSTDRMSNYAAEWLSRQHNLMKGLRLDVTTGEAWGDYDAAILLKPGDLLQADDTTNGGIDIINSEKIVVGRVLNNSPMAYDDFREMIKVCYGTANLSLKFSEFQNKSEQEKRAWYVVTVLNTPIDSNRRPTKKLKQNAKLIAREEENAA